MQGDPVAWLRGLAERAAEDGVPSVAERHTAAAEEIERLRKENHWLRADNGNLVWRNALLRDRPDLPADRIPAHTEMVRLQAETTRWAGIVRRMLVQPEPGEHWHPEWRTGEWWHLAWNDDGDESVEAIEPMDPADTDLIRQAVEHG